MPAGYGESLFHRIAVGPGEVISLTYAVDPGLPELAEELIDLASGDLPALLDDVGYHPRGLSVLRERIAEHFTESGLPTDADEIVVTTGAHQAIALVTQMYLRTGAAVVIEQPSWPGCFDLFGAAGGRVVGVPLDDAGIRPDLLTAAFAEHQPAMLFVMPTFHNPTGRLMSANRRRQVAELAAKHGVVVVEDNAYSAWDPAGPSIPPPLAAYAPDEAEVLTIGSVSKAVWGGLRIGWIRASRPLAERLARHKALADLGSPVIDQALTARLLPRLDRADRAAGAGGDGAEEVDGAVADGTTARMGMVGAGRWVGVVDPAAGHRRPGVRPGRAAARCRGGGGSCDGSDRRARRLSPGAVRVLRASA